MPHPVTARTLTPVEGRPWCFSAVSSRDPLRRYLVQVGPDGEHAVCQCPSYMTRARCWHVDEAVRLAQATRPQETDNVTTPETPSSTAVAVREHTPQELQPLTLQRPRTGLPSVAEIRIYNELARAAAGGAGVLVPRSLNSPAKCLMVMLAGREYGLGPMTAMKHIYPIEGRMEPSAQLMAALVTRRDPTAKFIWLQRDATGAVGELHREGKPVVRAEWTAEDSRRAKLNTKDNHAAYPTDMNGWMVVKRLCRLGASDLILFQGDEMDIAAATAESLLAMEPEEPEDDAGPLVDTDPVGQVVDGELVAAEGAPEPPQEPENGADAPAADTEPQEAASATTRAQLPENDAEMVEWWSGIETLMRERGVTEADMAAAMHLRYGAKNALNACKALGVDGPGLVAIAAAQAGR